MPTPPPLPPNRSVPCARSKPLEPKSASAAPMKAPMRMPMAAPGDTAFARDRHRHCDHADLPVDHCRDVVWCHRCRQRPDVGGRALSFPALCGVRCRRAEPALRGMDGTQRRRRRGRADETNCSRQRHGSPTASPRRRNASKACPSKTSPSAMQGRAARRFSARSASPQEAASASPLSARQAAASRPSSSSSCVSMTDGGPDSRGRKALSFAGAERPSRQHRSCAAGSSDFRRNDP